MINFSFFFLQFDDFFLIYILLVTHREFFLIKSRIFQQKGVYEKIYPIFLIRLHFKFNDIGRY